MAKSAPTITDSLLRQRGAPRLGRVKPPILLGARSGRKYISTEKDPVAGEALEEAIS